ncbi:Calx-beta domain-containing protein, partial [Pirellulales bacterium]|nr:Calx-beta domain-containing protein [Pirellulales bacterium]
MWDSHLAVEALEMRTLLAALPAVSITDATLLETDTASVQAQFSVQLTSAPESSATIRIDTDDGTATATSGDYAAVAGLILNFGPSLPLSQTVNIDVFGDTLPESDELFFVNLSQPNSLTIDDSQGVATIVNDDALPLVLNGVPVFNQKIQPNAPAPNGYGLYQDTGGSVYLHNGEFTESVTDLSITGRGYDWESTRTYRSGVRSIGPLGQNWDFADNRRLVEVNAGNLTSIQGSFPNAQPGDVVRMDGYNRADLYVNNGSGFDAPEGFFTRLEQISRGSFEERDSSGNIVVYGPPDANGLARMLSRSDRNDNTQTYQYDPLNRLEFVTDTLGRTIQYFYDPTTGFIQEVRDYLNRLVFFQYNLAGDLEAVTTPAVVGTPTGNDFPGGKTTVYSYSSGFAEERLNHNLETITAPNEVATGGPPRVTVVYETDTSLPSSLANLDRVLVHTVGGTNDSNVPSGGSIAYSYDNYVDFGQTPSADFDVDLDVDGFDVLAWQRGLGISSGATRAEGDADRDGDVDRNDVQIWESSYGTQLVSFADLSVAEIRTTVTDRNGNVTEHEFNRLGNHLAIREFTNRNVRAADPDFYETTFEYNADEKRLADRRVEGNSVERIYDEANPLRFQQGNLLQARWLADSDRAGDQTEIREAFTYEPIYNQLFTHVEARGLDPNHVPQNGGATSSARYTTTYAYDYQEGTDFAGLAAELGISALDVQSLLTSAGIPMGLGDVNGDGLTNQIAGNVLRVEFPTVHLLAGSHQAAIEGVTQQPIVALYEYNDFGQTVRQVDPEGNVTLFDYYSEQDPDGDGNVDNAAGDPTTGGYLREINADAVSDPIRNSGTDPTLTNVRSSFEYDPVGNTLRSIDGRGIATDYLVNERNQVVELVRAADHNLLTLDPTEPEPLVDFSYRDRFFYDFNDNLIRHQVEDRGNTSNVGVVGDINGNGVLSAADIDALYAEFGLPATPETDLFLDGVINQSDLDFLVREVLGTEYGDLNLDGLVDSTDQAIQRGNIGLGPGLGWADGDLTGDGFVQIADVNLLTPNLGFTGIIPPPLSFVDYVYSYDILDNLIEVREEVAVGDELVTRYRYDANENQVLTILPEGNATSAVLDERDLLFQTLRGATTPPPLVLFDTADPTNFDVRGGIASETTFHYDGNRNVIETVDAEDTDLSSANNSDLGGAGDRTRRILDGFDRLTSVIDSVGNQSVVQYDAAGNRLRQMYFGPDGGASPTADGPDSLPGPVSTDGVVQSSNLVSSNLLSANENLYDELNRKIQVDRVLFVNPTTTRPADVEDGATSLGKGDLTPGDNQAIAGLSGLPIQGRVSTRFEYDRNSRNTFIVEDDLDTSRSFYDGVGRVIEEADPEGNSVKYAYDDNNNVIEVLETDVSQVAGVADELFVKTYFFDALNRLQREVNNVGQTVDYRYDSRDNLVALADSQGPVTGNSIARRAFVGGPLTINTINDFGNVTTFEYDGIFRPVLENTILNATGSGDGVSIGASLEGVKNDPTAPESFLPTPDPSQGGGDGIIRVGTLYDDNSRVSSRIDDQGNVTLYLYDNLNRQVTETKGLTTNSTATGPVDKLRILGSREIVTPTASTINNPAVISTPLIDAQLAEAVSRWAQVAALFPTLATQVDDTPPTTIVTGYDPDHNVLIREDENDNEVFTRYDAINRAIATRVFRAGQTDSHASDPLFAPSPVADPSNPSVPLSPIVTVGANRQDFQFDGLSRLVLATDNNDPVDTADDSTVTNVFDSLSRVLEDAQALGATPATPVVTSTAWRAENLRSSLTYGNARTTEFTYDDLDRLNTIADAGAALPIVDYDYIGADRVLERDYVTNGTRLSYLDATGAIDVGYDGLKRVAQLQHLQSSTLIVGFAHTYDRMNNKLTDSKLHDSVNDEEYGYDSAYRLISLVRPNTAAITPEHSNFTLDGAGNWESVDGETRDHSSNNEIVTQFDPTGAPTSLTYDDNGNLTDDGDVEYQWDFLNRLRSVVRKSDGLAVAEYDYDAVGRRVRKTVTNSQALDGVTRFYYDGHRVIEERDGENQLTQQYVYGIYVDEVLQLSRDLTGDGSAIGAGDQQLYYHQNDLGSTYALTDATGTIVEGYLYDAYGGTTVYEPGANGNVDFGSLASGSDDVITGGGSSAVANPYLYAGRRLDAETDLYYYRTRYMDTSLGRFISRDTIGIWGDMAALGNGYVYVASNPLNNVDPMGQGAVFGQGTKKAVKDFQKKKSLGADGIVGPKTNAYFTADSFSFGVEREMKESGEKGGTADINIGVGELQECTISKSMDRGATGPMGWDNVQNKKWTTADSFSFG